MSAEMMVGFSHVVVWMVGGAVLALPALGVMVRLLRDLVR